jgi:tRNA (pseudouridine54-N1)-methyltransferase
VSAGRRLGVPAVNRRAFVIIGRTARADGQVRLDDIAGTSGRLDVLVRCVRAALCVSHGIRRSVVVHLVLLGGERPVAVRIDGAKAKFIRPDERALTLAVMKAVARHACEELGYVEQRNGIAVAFGALEAAIQDADGTKFVLEEVAPDLREGRVREGTFFIGDHLGFDEATRTRLTAIGARSVSVGPVSLHSDDVVTLVSNELDRVTSTP